jgi:hypothetical protein
MDTDIKKMPVEAIPPVLTPPDPWVMKMQARRDSLAGEQQRAVKEFQVAQQRAAEMQALIERLNGAITVIDELLKPEV